MRDASIRSPSTNNVDVVVDDVVRVAVVHRRKMFLSGRNPHCQAEPMASGPVVNPHTPGARVLRGGREYAIPTAGN